MMIKTVGFYHPENRFLQGKHDIFPSTNRILSAPGGLDAQQLVS
jgi:hypothetical protein